MLARKCIYKIPTKTGSRAPLSTNHDFPYRVYDAELLSTHTPSSYPTLLNVVIFPPSFSTLLSLPTVLIWFLPSGHAMPAKLSLIPHDIRSESTSLQINNQTGAGILPTRITLYYLIPSPHLYLWIRRLIDPSVAVGSFGARPPLSLHRSIYRNKSFWEGYRRRWMGRDG
jgi:hypothetical protein